MSPISRAHKRVISPWKLLNSTSNWTIIPIRRLRTSILTNVRLLKAPWIVNDRRVSTFRGAGAFSKEDTLYYSRGYRGARPSYAWACYIGHRHHSQPVIRTRTHTRTRAYPQPWFRIIVVATETRVTEYGTVKVLRLFPWCSRFLQLWTPIERIVSGCGNAVTKRITGRGNLLGNLFLGPFLSTRLEWKAIFTIFYLLQT